MLPLTILPRYCESTTLSVTDHFVLFSYFFVLTCLCRSGFAQAGTKK